MVLLRTPWLLLVLLGQQVSLSSAARSKNRGADTSVTSGRGGAQRAGLQPVATPRGKFTTKDQVRCTWTAGDVGDEVKLSVRCSTGLACQYMGKPRGCAGYLSDPRGFWKQVARALKKLQGKVCTDESELVKVGTCKRAPRDSHFRLDRTERVEPGTPTRPAAPAAPNASAACADHRSTAEEYCSSSWASVCSFVFSMLQGDC